MISFRKFVWLCCTTPHCWPFKLTEYPTRQRWRLSSAIPNTLSQLPLEVNTVEMSHAVAVTGSFNLTKHGNPSSTVRTPPTIKPIRWMWHWEDVTNVVLLCLPKRLSVSGHVNFVLFILQMYQEYMSDGVFYHSKHVAVEARLLSKMMGQCEHVVYRYRHISHDHSQICLETPPPTACARVFLQRLLNVLPKKSWHQEKYSSKRADWWSPFIDTLHRYLMGFISRPNINNNVRLCTGHPLLWLHRW